MGQRIDMKNNIVGVLLAFGYLAGIGLMIAFCYSEASPENKDGFFYVLLFTMLFRDLILEVVGYIKTKLHGPRG